VPHRDMHRLAPRTLVSASWLYTLLQGTRCTLARPSRTASLLLPFQAVRGIYVHGLQVRTLSLHLGNSNCHEIQDTADTEGL
jgi:hypothetical protein